ncbi:protogenin A isoform X2 [Lates japonicus]|uniref:Protogenin A isoform X2 n=1 Tax=Lates japonicus TaxID=270547 RepID=A0AAD3MR98_LATJO|nr:protogenin A isoform X2 [Lates japonicus]
MGDGPFSGTAEADSASRSLLRTPRLSFRGSTHSTGNFQQLKRTEEESAHLPSLQNILALLNKLRIADDCANDESNHFIDAKNMRHGSTSHLPGTTVLTHKGESCLLSRPAHHLCRSCSASQDTEGSHQRGQPYCNR